MICLYVYIFLACSKGYFGTGCSWECSPNCRPDTCLHTDGSCTVCAAGWTGYNCTTGNSNFVYSQVYKYWLCL